MPRTYARTNRAKRERLQTIIAEIKGRGLEVPQDLIDQLGGVAPKYVWNIDENGWFRGRTRIFKPNPKQLPFIQSTSYYAALVAGRGSGKSCVGAQKSMQKIRDGESGIVINPSFEDFKISTWTEFKEWIDWSMVIPKDRHRVDPGWEPQKPFTLHFNNGAWCICKGLKDPNSARGPNVNWLWYDEFGKGDPTGLDWQIAVASVRVGKNPQAWATGTPAGRDHWAYKFFVEQIIPEDALEAFKQVAPDRSLVEYFYTTIMDNKDNLDPAFYASMLAAYPEGWLRQQELMGEFVNHGQALGNRAWFDGKRLSLLPSDVNIVKRVRFWDLAATEKKIAGSKTLNDPDETVGTLVAWDGGDKFFIEDQVAGFWAWDNIKKNLFDTAVRDGPYVYQCVEEEPGAGGKNQVAELVEFLRNYLPHHPTLQSWRPEGDKVMRANVWFAEAAQGRWYMLYGSWNNAFLDQLGSFGVGRHDDRIDSVSGARHVLAPIRLWRHVPFLYL